MIINKIELIFRKLLSLYFNWKFNDLVRNVEESWKISLKSLISNVIISDIINYN